MNQSCGRRPAELNWLFTFWFFPIGGATAVWQSFYAGRAPFLTQPCTFKAQGDPDEQQREGSRPKTHAGFVAHFTPSKGLSKSSSQSKPQIMVATGFLFDLLTRNFADFLTRSSKVLLFENTMTLLFSHWGACQ